MTTDQLLPALTGLAYCNVIEGCQEVYDLRRSQEWTAALTRWCDGQPDLVPYAGQCLVHRSEISQLRGDWVAALEEAIRACDRLAGRPAIANAYYQLAEMHRLRGEFAEAEQAYRRVGEFGREPQPGLALLRLAEDRVSVAAAAIARVLDEASDRVSRCRVLPAYVEIMLTTGELSAAKIKADELFTIAETLGAPFLRAVATHARGAVTLATGDPPGALIPLRRSVSLWRQMDAPYEAARVRVLVGQACRALGDADSAAIEFDAANQVFQQVGAASDLDRLRNLIEFREAQLSARIDSSRGAGSEPRDDRTNQPSDLLDINDQRAYGRQAPAEHLQQTRRVLTDRGYDLRSRTEHHLTRPGWSDLTIPVQRDGDFSDAGSMLTLLFGGMTEQVETVIVGGGQAGLGRRLSPCPSTPAVRDLGRQ